jgi:hypothetical protein
MERNESGLSSHLVGKQVLVVVSDDLFAVLLSLHLLFFETTEHSVYGVLVHGDTLFKHLQGACDDAQLRDYLVERVGQFIACSGYLTFVHDNWRWDLRGRNY